MQSDIMQARTDSVPLAGAAHNFPYLPQVSLSFEMPAQPVAIAEMADLFGVTHRTLHFYEEKGLITARRSGSMRVYDRVQIHRMAVINACREIGIPVAVIQDSWRQRISGPIPRPRTTESAMAFCFGATCILCSISACSPSIRSHTLSG